MMLLMSTVQASKAYWKTEQCIWRDQVVNLDIGGESHFGYACNDHEVIVGFKLNNHHQTSQDHGDPTSVLCCNIFGHSSVTETCDIFKVGSDGVTGSEAACDASAHKVFTGVYDSVQSANDVYTETRARKCCEVHCDADYCTNGDWGVNHESCQTITADYPQGGEDVLLTCPAGTLMTKVIDSESNHHVPGVNMVHQIECCDLDLVSPPTRSPSPEPTTEEPTLAPSPAPTTDMPTQAPSSQNDCLWDIERCSNSRDEYIAAVWECVDPSHPNSISSQTVTCRFTIDNVVSMVRYNGADLEVSGGHLADFRQAKEFSYFPIPGAYLEISGYEARPNSDCGCACSGLLLECDNGFISNVDNWQAIGSNEAIAQPSESDFDEPCVSTSGFWLDGQESAAQKIWANNGATHALMRAVPVRCSLNGLWAPNGYPYTMDVSEGNVVESPSHGPGIGTMNTDGTVHWWWQNTDSEHTGTFSDDCATITWENNAFWTRSTERRMLGEFPLVDRLMKT